MIVEQQYIDLFSQTEAMICKHSAEVLNAPRAAAFADFERLGFPTRKMEKYKYTDVSKYFEPDYGLNLNRLAIPVNPYEVFKCDVPNMEKEYAKKKYKKIYEIDKLLNDCVMRHRNV